MSAVRLYKPTGSADKQLWLKHRHSKSLCRKDIGATKSQGTPSNKVEHQRRCVDSVLWKQEQCIRHVMVKHLTHTVNSISDVTSCQQLDAVHGILQLLGSPEDCDVLWE